MSGCRNKSNTIVHRWTFLTPQILTWLDIAISIGGFVTVSKKDSDQLLPTDWSRASTGIMALIFLYTVGIAVYFWLRRQQFAKEERRLADCIAICVPLLFIRVLYSVIFVVTADMTWNAVKGSPTAYLMMTFLPEVAFVATCIITIRSTEPGVQDRQGGKHARVQEERRSVLNTAWPGR